jgi:hypothetical protein
MSPSPEGFQIRRHALKGWAGRGLVLGIFDDLDPAGFVKGSRFFPRVIDRDRLPLYFHAGLEPMFLMRSLTDRDQKFAGIPAANPIGAKHIPLVTVAALIEGP